MPRDEKLRYELIGGEMIVSTAPRFIHQLLATRLMGVFLDYLKEHWVVNPFDKEIIVFKRKKGELLQTDIFKENDFLQTSFLSELKLDINKLFAN
jgi:Uma2 family endonuclease